MKKLQIFVSSTYNDLQDERQEVVAGILNAGHIPAGMELFGGAGSVIKTIQRWIDASDMCILLLGGTYGSIYEQEKMSYTEWEYRYAKSCHKPVCAIILSDNMLHKNAIKYGEKCVVYERRNKKKYAAFSKYVKNNGVYIMVSECTEIQGAVQRHITATMNDPDYDLIGWVRGDSYIREWDKLSFESLKSIYMQVFQSYISKLYNSLDGARI